MLANCNTPMCFQIEAKILKCVSKLCNLKLRCILYRIMSLTTSNNMAMCEWGTRLFNFIRHSQGVNSLSLRSHQIRDVHKLYLVDYFDKFLTQRMHIWRFVKKLRSNLRKMDSLSSDNQYFIPSPVFLVLRSCSYKN